MYKRQILGWLAVILVSIVLRFTDWYFLDPLLSLLIAIFILSQSLPKFWDNIKIFLDHVPSDIDLGQLYQELGSLDNVQAVAQLNVWTTDGIDKYAMIHICLKETEKSQETRQAVHQLVKMCIRDSWTTSSKPKPPHASFACPMRCLSSAPRP